MKLRDTIKTSISTLKGAPPPHELVDDTAKPWHGKPQHWGYHLLLDVSDCNKNIDDEDAIRTFLKELITALDMKALTKPQIIRVDNEDGRGVSAVQMITTSSITFHGDDEAYSAYIDIFSCKVFKPETAIKLVQDHFKPKHIGKLWLYRDAGNYPK